MAFSPTPNDTDRAPVDEVCQLPTPDRHRVKLVYYDRSSEPTFTLSAPADANLADLHLIVLREGRAYGATQHRDHPVLHFPGSR